MESFDPYAEWLGIDDQRRPPTHYAILGLKEGESQPAVIDRHAQRQKEKLSEHLGGPNARLAKRLAFEIEAARGCLAHAEKRAAYDRLLHGSQRQGKPGGPACRQAPVGTPVPSIAAHAAGHDGNAGVVARPAKPRIRSEPHYASPLPAATPVTSHPAPGVLGEQWPQCRLFVAIIAATVLFTVGLGAAAVFWKSGRSHTAAGPLDARSDVIPTPPIAVDAEDDLPVPPEPPPPAPPADDDTWLEIPGHMLRAAHPKSMPEDQLADKDEKDRIHEPAPPGDESVARRMLPEPQAPIARRPVPSASEQEKIRRMIDELYDPAALRTSDDNQRLVDELTALAEKVERAEERFVLLRRASELASEEGDSQRVHELVTRIADEFEVDRLSEQVSILKDFAERATGEDQIKTVVVGSAGLIHEALETDRFDLAESLSLAVLDACQSPAGRAFHGEALEVRREVQELHNEWKRMQVAHRTLELSPDDVAAHTIVARWYCLVRDNWDLALPHLAKSSDPKLRVLANLELRTSAEDAVAQVSLGDAWWTFVQETGSDSRPAWEARTAYWYEMAWPHITSPLQKAKVQKRLVELGRPDPELPRRDSEDLEFDHPAPLPLGERRLSDLMEGTERLLPEHDRDSDSPAPQGTECKACNGKGVIYNKCPNRMCARGRVRDHRIEVVGRNPVSGQAMVQRVPVRVPCPVCRGNYIRKESCSECGGRGTK